MDHCTLSSCGTYLVMSSSFCQTFMGSYPFGLSDVKDMSNSFQFLYCVNCSHGAAACYIAVFHTVDHLIGG